MDDFYLQEPMFKWMAIKNKKLPLKEFVVYVPGVVTESLRRMKQNLTTHSWEEVERVERLSA